MRPSGYIREKIPFGALLDHPVEIHGSRLREPRERPAQHGPGLKRFKQWSNLGSRSRKGVDRDIPQLLNGSVHLNAFEFGEVGRNCRRVLVNRGRLLFSSGRSNLRNWCFQIPGHWPCGFGCGHRLAGVQCGSGRTLPQWGLHLFRHGESQQAGDGDPGFPSGREFRAGPYIIAEIDFAQMAQIVTRLSLQKSHLHKRVPLR